MLDHFAGSYNDWRVHVAGKWLFQQNRGGYLLPCRKQSVYPFVPRLVLPSDNAFLHMEERPNYNAAERQTGLARFLLFFLTKVASLLLYIIIIIIHYYYILLFINYYILLSSFIIITSFCCYYYYYILLTTSTNYEILLPLLFHIK